LQLTLLPEMVYLRTLSLQNNYILCKFVRLDHAEAWKLLGQKPSGFFQKLKTTTLTKHLHQWFPKWAVPPPWVQWETLGGRWSRNGRLGGAEAEM